MRDWQQATGLLAHGRVLPAVLLTAPLGVPAGLAAGGLWWARRTAAVAAGAAGRHAYAPAAFDARQWRRQARAARGLLAAPGPFPLVTRSGMVPAGAVIRAVGRRWTPVLAIPTRAFARHMVIVGASGTGKTNLMIRLWAGWYAAALTAATRGKPRPLLCALDCKGGPDARAKAARTARVLRGAGARRVAIWPDDATVSLWALPPRDLAVLLHQMTEHGDGAAAYYADVEQAVLMLAVSHPAARPAAPPTSSPASTPRGWRTPTPATRPPCRRCAPPRPTPATSRCGTRRCWAGSAPRSTAPAACETPTPGTSSWRAPANRALRRRRRWRSPS